MGKQKQNKVYEVLYKTKEYSQLDLPDYKITAHKQIKNKRVLVFGIGTARDTKYLARNNIVWGVDNSKSALKEIKKYGIRAIYANLDKPVDGIKGKFDVVVAKDILEHLESPEILLSQIRKYLKQDGYAVINVPNHFFALFRLRMIFGKNLIWKSPGHDHTELFEEWDYMHKAFFTWKGFKKFLNTKGFKITKTFWDFGDLSHYSQPETVLEYLKQTNKDAAKVKLLETCWKIFNFVFPKSLRSVIVKISPGFFCSSFYVWCKKIN